MTLEITTTTNTLVLASPEQSAIVLNVPAAISLDLQTQGTQGTASPPTWEFYAANWSTPPTQVSTTAAGAVYSYVLDGVTRYRLVPAVYDPTDDAFYSTFTGGVLSGLIVSRG